MKITRQQRGLIAAMVMSIAVGTFAMPAAAQWNAPSQWSGVIADYVAKGYDNRTTANWNIWISARGNSLWSSESSQYGYNCSPYPYRGQPLDCQEYDLNTGNYLGRTWWVPPFYSDR